MIKKISFLVRSPLFLSFASGLMLSLPYFHGSFWFFSWFALLPLLFALKNQNAKWAFLLAFFCGVIFWTATIYWLAYVSWLGTIILIVYLSFYFGLFGFFFSLKPAYSGSAFIFYTASVWVLLEYLRGFLFSGFPWALLGYSQSFNLPIIQIADITGVWGVSFIIVLANTAMFFALLNKKLISIKRNLGLTLALLFIITTYGIFKIYFYKKTQRSRVLKLALVQGNIPQDLKWEESFEAFILSEYLKLSTEAAKSKPHMIIWPEAAFPGIFTEKNRQKQLLSESIKNIGLPFLIGAVRKDGEDFYNSALLFSPDGKIQDYYDKIHLVPFGEYVPWRKFLPFLEVVVPIGDITPGKDFKIFSLKVPEAKKRFYQDDQRISRVHFSTLICFEDIFPYLARRFALGKTDFLVNITNDAWYKFSPASWQHLQASIFRAIETRLPLVRAANTGISAFIHPSGKMLSWVKSNDGQWIFVQGAISDEITLPINKKLSFYSRWGDLFIFLAVSFVLFFLFTKKKISVKV